MFPSVTEALQSLRCYQLPLSVSGATSYLRGVKTKVELLGLYQHFFPTEFNASTTTLTPAETGGYSEREVEFLGLVNDNLFPIHEVYGYAGEEERYFDSIPVVPDTCDWCEDFYEWSPGWQLLLVLEGRVFDYFEPEEIARCSDLLQWGVEQIGEPLQVERDWLAERCTQVVEPLSFLAEAIAEIQYNTGNLWLDAVLEFGHTIEDHEWSIANVQGLADLWREAQQIQAHTTELTKWIEADPKKHFHQVIELWKSSQAV